MLLCKLLFHGIELGWLFFLLCFLRLGLLRVLGVLLRLLDGQLLFGNLLADGLVLRLFVLILCFLTHIKMPPGLLFFRFFCELWLMERRLLGLCEHPAKVFCKIAEPCGDLRVVHSCGANDADHALHAVADVKLRNDDAGIFQLLRHVLGTHQNLRRAGR